MASINQLKCRVVTSNHMSSWSTGSQKIREQAAKYGSRPDVICDNVIVGCEHDCEFTLKLRIPAWAKGKVVVLLNGESYEHHAAAGEFLSIHRVWKNDTVTIVLPMTIEAYPLPDMPDVAGFRYGPMTLAGLCNEERTLYGNIENPAAFFTPDNEREWGAWKPTFRLRHQPVGMRFVPLKEIGYETYTVYFPIRKKADFGEE